jgi:hypothetical protein
MLTATHIDEVSAVLRDVCIDVIVPEFSKQNSLKTWTKGGDEIVTAVDIMI